MQDCSTEELYQTGMKLKNGEGIDIDKKGACEYFRQAAEKDHIDSMYEYGKMLLTGDGIDMNKEESCKYLKKAAVKGHTKAILIYIKIIFMKNMA